MTLLAAFAVVATVATTAMLAATVDWGDTTIRLTISLLPFAVMHIVGSRVPRAVPSWLAFVSGLAMDVATHGPLGYWAAAYLAGLLITRAASGITGKRPLARIGLALAAIGVSVVAQAVLASLYAWRPVDFSTLLAGSLPLAAGLALLEPLIPADRRSTTFDARTAALRRGT